MTDWIPTLDALSNFRFIRPLVLLGLALLPVAFFVLHRANVQRGAWAQLIDPALQRFVLTTSLQRKGKSRSWLAYLLAALLIIALAGPTWEQLPQPVYTQQQPVVIALDLSQSMNAQDLIPTRLQVAKIKLRDMLRKRRDGQTALITFAGDAFLVTPLTDDTQTIVSMLPSLTPRIMPSQGSRIEPALVMAGNLLNQAGSEPGEVILITDGASDGASAEDMASQLARDGHRVSVVAVGTSQGGLIKNNRGEFLRDRRGEMVMAPLQLDPLRNIAASGGGVLFNSSVTDEQLDKMLTRDVSGFADATSSDQEFTTDLWREQGPLLVLLCLPFIALAFRRGVLLCVVAFVIMPPPAEAGIWSDAWKRRDQQGQAAFEKGEYELASELYQEQQWKAAALYRAGKFADSAAMLEGIDSPEANYNRGNALAKAEEIDGAIKAYERTLVQQPEHEDAEFNLALLKQKQQEQQSEEQQNQEEGDQEQSDQEQPGEDGDSQEKSDSDEQSEQSEQDESEESEEQESEEQESQSEDEREAEQQRMQAELAEQMTEEEQQQAVEQWLQRVPDDPGGLLRRKFKRQYRERGPARRNSGEEW
ncbi:MAG: VWA domain-containing protein [Gammaproteobacteria bacterium]